MLGSDFARRRGHGGWARHGLPCEPLPRKRPSAAATPSPTGQNGFVTTNADRLLLWSPRVLGVAVALFLGMFALDAFEEHQTIAGVPAAEQSGTGVRRSSERLGHPCERLP